MTTAASKTTSTGPRTVASLAFDERSFLLRHARITAELGTLFTAPPAAAG